MNSGSNLSDPDLPPEETERLLGAFIRKREEDALRKKWSAKLAAEHGVVRQPSRGIQRRLPGRVMGYAVAIAATVAILIFALPSLSAPSGQQLLTEAIGNLELVTTRSAETDEANRLRASMTSSFQRGRYDSARTAGEGLIALPNVTPDDRMSLGLVYLKTSDYTAARALFTEIRSTNITHSPEATYYSAISYLASGDIQNGLDLLRQLDPKTAGRYHARAQRLLTADWDITPPPDS